MDLENIKAVVTGVTGGFGRAMALQLVQKGATVYGVARTVKTLNEIQNQLGERFVAVPLDITNVEGIKIWVDETFDEQTSPNILVNNAGAGYFDKMDELSLEKWDRMIQTNLNGTFYLTRCIVPLMKQNEDVCHIINIGSILGTIGNPEMAAYCATKFGTVGFSEALFKELRYDEIKVSCINPGSIETDFFAESGVEKHDNMLQPEDLAETVIHILETPDNMLVSDLTVRPLNPKKNG